MNTEEQTAESPALRNAIIALQVLIQQHYPQAVFSVASGDDPTGVYLRVYLDVADTEAVVDVYLDQLLHFQIEEQLPLYVIPVRPVSKVHEATEAQRRSRRRQRGVMLPLPSGQA